jgi:hypothetical protein
MRCVEHGTLLGMLTSAYSIFVGKKKVEGKEKN